MTFKAPRPPCLLHECYSKPALVLGVMMGSQSLWFCLLEDHHFLGMEKCALQRACSTLATLPQVQRAGFFFFFFFLYCPCQLADQGYWQLSVRALILVSHGQVLLVICYLSSFVQPSSTCLLISSLEISLLKLTITEDRNRSKVLCFIEIPYSSISHTAIFFKIKSGRSGQFKV